MCSPSTALRATRRCNPCASARRPSMLEFFAFRGGAGRAARAQIDTRVRSVKKLASYQALAGCHELDVRLDSLRGVELREVRRGVALPGSAHAWGESGRVVDVDL